MYKIRKIWATVAVVGAAALVLSACTADDNGNSAPQSHEKSTLEFWTMPFGGQTEAQIDDYVKEFNSSQEDITVNVTHLQFADGRDKITQAIAAGNGPDVFMMAPINQDYINSGTLASLTDLGYTTKDIDPFLDIIRNAAGADGKVYGVPFGYSANVLYYNKTILAKYGFNKAPSDWDQLQTVAKTITTKSAAEGTPVSGFQIDGMDDHLNAINHVWADFFYGAGGKQLTKDLSTSAVNSAAGKTALNYLKSFVSDGISIKGLSAERGFMDGKVAMFTFQQMFMADMAKSSVKDDWALAPMPAGPKANSSYVDGEFIVANSAGKHLSASGTFMKWMTSPEQAVKYMKVVSVFPYKLDAVTKSVRDQVQAIVDADPNRGVLLEQIKRADGLNMQYERYAQSVRWASQSQNIVAAINGDKSVNDALSAIADDVDKALAGTGK